MIDTDYRYRRMAKAARDARAGRIAAMWARFCRLTGRRSTGWRLSDGEKRSVIREAIAADAVPGWRFRSSLEAADLGMDHDFRPAPGPTTEAEPGTLAKVNVLEHRAACGLELFVDGDGDPARRLQTGEGVPGR